MTEPHMTEAEWNNWVGTRPRNVQSLIHEFPIRLLVHFADGVSLYVIGWTENDQLLMSEVDPVEDWEAARAKYHIIDAKPLRADGVRAVKQ